MNALYTEGNPFIKMINLDVEKIVINAKLSQLESLNSEIRFSGCKTVGEVVDLINSDMNLLNKMIKENQANQYEADAKADHFTSEGL